MSLMEEATKEFGKEFKIKTKDDFLQNQHHFHFILENSFSKLEKFDSLINNETFGRLMYLMRSITMENAGEQYDKINSELRKVGIDFRKLISEEIRLCKLQLDRGEEVVSYGEEQDKMHLPDFSIDYVDIALNSSVYSGTKDLAGFIVSKKKKKYALLTGFKYILTFVFTYAVYVLIYVACALMVKNSIISAIPIFASYGIPVWLMNLLNSLFN